MEGAKNLFLMCASPRRDAQRGVPSGFHLRRCRRDEVETWSALQRDEQPNPELDSILADFFERAYAPYGDLFFERCTFACDASDRPVGSLLAWKAYDRVNTLHSFKVLPEYEGLGLGRALMTHVLGELSESDYPVFLHTHPQGYRALKLYTDFGFALLTDPVIGYRDNHLTECLPYLKENMTQAAYASLRTASSPAFFLEAAASTEFEQF